MRLEVALSKLNGKYALACVEDIDTHTICVTDGRHKNAKAACLSAAKALREAALRFEALAEEPDPYKYTTHQAINRKRL